MNITKIKRMLASVKIGNPLNQLIYTKEEIDSMKKEQQNSIPTVEPIRRAIRGTYGIEVKMGDKYSLLPKKIRFSTPESAFKWGMWNYKGRTYNFRVVKITQNIQIENVELKTH